MVWKIGSSSSSTRAISPYNWCLILLTKYDCDFGSFLPQCRKMGTLLSDQTSSSQGTLVHKVVKCVVFGRTTEKSETGAEFKNIASSWRQSHWTNGHERFPSCSKVVSYLQCSTILPIRCLMSWLFVIVIATGTASIVWIGEKNQTGATSHITHSSSSIADRRMNSEVWTKLPPWINLARLTTASQAIRRAGKLHWTIYDPPTNRATGQALWYDCELVR